MAYITGSVFDSLGILPFSLAAGTQLTMSIQNNSNAPSYYGLETIPNNNGFYTSATPKNTSGSYISGSGISYITYDDYKMVAVVNPGGGTLVYTPSVAVSASTVWTKGTGASLLPADFGTLLPGSYNQRVVNSGGYVESPDSITAAIAATPILKDASFLYIPSGYSSGTAFSELSTNDYGDLTWTRASDGTRTNSEGLVQRVPWNLLQYSEDFSNAYWTKSATSISANSTNAPNGTLTADTLTADGTSAQHYVRSSYNVTSGTVYTVSFYAKKDTNDFLQLFWLAGQFGGSAWANFDLNSGVVGSVGGSITASIENIGNGWYRCIMTATATATASSSISAVLISSSTSLRAESNTLTTSAFIWGAQLVEGTSAQSYLPTTTRLNVPRLDYTYGTSPASLMEPQRTNLVLYSQQFDDASWTKNASSVTANTTTSPDGNTNADTLTANGLLDAHFISQGISVTSGASYSLSVYAKKSTNNFIQISFPVVTFGLNSFANFNLDTGVVGTVGSSATATITNVGSGWYRCNITATSSATGVNSSLILIVNSATSARAESNTLSTSVFLWGAQLEAGAYPTTYIPTTSATATRVADSFSRSNIFTNGLITSSGGTWFVELRNNVAYTRDGVARFGIGDTSAINLNSLHIGSLSSTTTRQQIYKTVAGSYFLLYTTLTDTVKIAIKWNGSTADVFVNGTKVVSATSFTTTNMELLKDSGGLTAPTFIQQMALYSQPIAGVDMGVLTGASYYPSFLNMAQALNYTIA